MVCSLPDDRRRRRPALQRFRATHQAVPVILATGLVDPAVKTSLASFERVWLLNRNFPGTRTITHTMWRMFGLLPKVAVQFPHRHARRARKIGRHARHIRTGRRMQRIQATDARNGGHAGVPQSRQ